MFQMQGFQASSFLERSSFSFLGLSWCHSWESRSPRSPTASTLQALERQDKFMIPIYMYEDEWMDGYFTLIMLSFAIGPIV